MRVSGGILKGRKIKFTQPQKQLRPTPSKVREAIFDILRGRIENASFLDLYAGTGAIGFEALSRGASEVVFVEAKRSYANRITQIAEQYGFEEKAKVITNQVLNYIQLAGLNNLTFDIIFLDPPYHTDEVIHALSEIERSGILKESGAVIAEHFIKRQLPEKFGILHKIKDYIYGDTVLSLYKMSQ